MFSSVLFSSYAQCACYITVRVGTIMAPLPCQQLHPQASAMVTSTSTPGSMLMEVCSNVKEITQICQVDGNQSLLVRMSAQTESTIAHMRPRLSPHLQVKTHHGNTASGRNSIHTATNCKWLQQHPRCNKLHLHTICWQDESRLLFSG